MLLSGVQGITDLITTPGLINLDFADVKSVMSGAGSALMGIGSARGDDRSVAAAEMAISSPLLEASIDGAHGVLLSIQGGSDLGLFEINEAAQLVANSAAPDANIIFGAVIDDALGDEVRVTVIAAGFDEAELGRARSGRVRSPAATRAAAGGSPRPAAATRRPRRARAPRRARDQQPPRAGRPRPTRPSRRRPQRSRLRSTRPRHRDARRRQHRRCQARTPRLAPLTRASRSRRSAGAASRRVGRGEPAGWRARGEWQRHHRVGPRHRARCGRGLAAGQLEHPAPVGGLRGRRRSRRARLP